MENIYTYTYNRKKKILYVWENNAILAEISDVLNNQDDIFSEIVYDLRGIII